MIEKKIHQRIYFQVRKQFLIEGLLGFSESDLFVLEVENSVVTSNEDVPKDPHAVLDVHAHEAGHANSLVVHGYLEDVVLAWGGNGASLIKCYT